MAMAYADRGTRCDWRIFQEFVEGQAESNIMTRLNLEGVQGRWRSKGGWSPATVQDS